MTHKLTIRNFGPIEECNVELKQFNVLTGPQSNGKSTIAKAIYYFRTVKQDILNIMMQGGPVNYTGEKSAKWSLTIQQNMREKFLQIFGTSWIMPRNMDLKYDFGRRGVSIHVYLTDDRYNFARNYICIEFGSGFEDYLNSLDDHVFINTTPGQMESERKQLSQILNDPYETVFIPAGRNLITLLSTQLNYIFTSLESSQLRSIDYITKRYTELILKLKPMFTHGMDEYYEDIKESADLAKKYTSNRAAINLLLDIARTVINGSYRCIEGEERLYLDSRRYVKINFASSGQQEIVWVFNLLFYYLAEDKKTFVILEEPESHLYPDSQRRIGELLGLFLNENRNQILVTTHSPYLLGTFNYMLQASQASESAKEQIKRKLRKRMWLLPQNVSAYFVQQGEVENALDESDGLTLIKNELIDGASEEINNLSDFILEQDYNMEELNG